MVNPIPESVRKTWDEWNIRGVILSSLCLQAILTLFAPSRKRATNKLVIMLLWSVYLLADVAAVFALGLISNTKTDALDQPSTPSDSTTLLAFWPPFLILHLGGPDNITAFALEDNELWLRHFVSLLVQVVAAVYIFLLSLPQTKLAVPTILMFIAASIKYLERTSAFYLASLEGFQNPLSKEPFPVFDFGVYRRITIRICAWITVRICAFGDATGESHEAQQTSESHEARQGGESHEARQTGESHEAPRTGESHEAQRTGESLEAEQTGESHEAEQTGESHEAQQIRESHEAQQTIVHDAYEYLKILRGLIGNHIFSFREHEESRKFFCGLSPEAAYRRIEVELNFIYEFLYTKVQVVCSEVGFRGRYISFGLVVAAFVIFHFKVNKHGFDELDVAISYTLFSGAIALDIIGVFIFFYSDFTVGAIVDKSTRNHVFRLGAIVDTITRNHVSSVFRLGAIVDTNTRNHGSFVFTLVDTLVCKFLCKMLDWILNLKKPKWHACDNHSDECRQKVLATPSLFGRWSGYVSGYNLLSYCLERRPTARVHKIRNCLHRCIQKIIHSLVILFFHLARVHALLNFLGLADFLDGIRFVSHEPLTKEVWEFIFNELREKSQLVNNPEAAMKISSARGESILNERDYCSSLLPYVSQVTYDESILVWHIATELLYQSDPQVSNDNYSHCEISKVLSDYMLYLLIIQPSVMSSVTGIAKIRFRDTRIQIIEVLKRYKLKTKEEKEVCEEILAMDPYEYKQEAKRLGGKSISILFDACILAKELKKLDDLEEGKKEEKWELISKVWVEMLSYAASSSGSRVHAQQVNRGGELITFVWLLMAHFGLQRQFQNITPHEDE